MFEAFIRLFCSVLDALSLDEEIVRKITDSVLDIERNAGKEIGGEDDEEKMDDEGNDG